ncbi:MAG TPA: VOC family protein [Candidatus Dormibacteraeota bacterium]|nr:VOC family protein [Candidatus Dormibacteraeota bacterium]
MDDVGVRPVRLGHVGLAVRDLVRMVEFYRDVLGFEVSDRMAYPDGGAVAEGVWLRCNADHHVLALFQPAAATAGGRGPFGLHHLAFELASFEDLRRAARVVRERHGPLHASRQGGPGCQLRIYFPDPEGNLIELYWGLDQIGWDGRSRPYPPIEDLDLETFDLDAFLAWKGTRP